MAPADEAAVGELQAVVDALRRFRADAQVPPGKVLSALFVEEAAGQDGAAARYAPYTAAFRALAKTEIAFEG